MSESGNVGIDLYLDQLWDRKATDLLLTAGSRPLIRVDGLLHPLEGESILTPEDTEGLIFGLLNEELAERFRRSRQVDFSFSLKDKARFRGNAFVQRGSVALALRVIPYDIPTFDQIGLPPAAQKLVRLPQGLILVTGPTGAGKSTTIASMLDDINGRRAAHILTIEDPIEYVHRHRRSAVNQREVGTDTDSFADALRAALREDPDVLMVGEMRDLESIQIALTVAETGHLVFATLHTNDTAQALDRIVDVFPGDRQTQIRVQLANSLAGIIHQRLVPRRTGGRVAAFELLLATYPVRNLIREGKTRQIRNVLGTAQKEGMQTLEASLSGLVAAGVVDFDEAVSHSLYPNEVKKSVQPAGGRRG